MTILFISCSSSQDSDQKLNLSLGSSDHSENIPIKKDLGLNVSNDIKFVTPMPLATPLTAVPPGTPLPAAPAQPSLKKNYNSSKPVIVPVPPSEDFKVDPSAKIPVTIATTKSVPPDLEMT